MTKRDPNIDYGFHAVVPRIVRTDYKDVTPHQKWLYVCLKDLCGDTGTCYRTLRALSEETGISTGLLSESVPVLHKVGLIHAEKKKRSTGGKEVWHITIVDIWGANAKEYPTKKRSHSEQECSPDEQTSENVQDVNENVHHVNDTPSECSPREPECSQIPYRSNNTGSTNITEERTVEEYIDASLTPSQEKIVDKQQSIEETPKETNGQSVTLPSIPDSNSAGGNPSESGNEAPKVKKVTRKAERDEVTQKRIAQVYDAMDEFKRKLMGDETATFQHTKKGDTAIEGLLSQNPTPKKLLQVMNDMWNESDRNGDHFWRKHMKPHTICSEYESRIMALDVQQEISATPKPLSMPPRPKTREELRAEAY